LVETPPTRWSGRKAAPVFYVGGEPTKPLVPLQLLLPLLGPRLKLILLFPPQSRQSLSGSPCSKQDIETTTNPTRPPPPPGLGPVRCSRSIQETEQGRMPPLDLVVPSVQIRFPRRRRPTRGPCGQRTNSTPTDWNGCNMEAGTADGQCPSPDRLHGRAA